MAGTARTRAQLTTEPGAPFRTGNVPTNGDFQNLAASHFNLLDDDASRITVDPVSQDFLEAELGALPLEAGGVRALLAGVVNKLVSLLPFTVRTVDTIAELRALAGDTRRAVYVRGYWAPGDEGGGMFRFDPSRIAEDDGGLCIAGWVRTRTGRLVSPEMFGARGNGIDDDTIAINAAWNSGYSVAHESRRTYRISAPINAVSNLNVQGFGSVLTCANGQYFNGVLIRDCDHVIINDLEVAGPSTGSGFDYGFLLLDSRNVVLEDIVVRHVGFSGTPEKGIGIVVNSAGFGPVTDSMGCQNITITRPRVYDIRGLGNFRGDSLYLRCCTGVRVSGGVFDGAARNGVQISDYVKDVTVRDMNIKNVNLVGIDIEPDLETGTQGINILGNNIRNFGCKPAGFVGVQFFGIDVHGKNINTIIANNTIQAVDAQSIACICAIDNAGDTKIIGNTLLCDNKAKNGILLYAGAGAKRTIISSNHIYDFVVRGIDGYDNDVLIISGNHIKSISNSADYGIYLLSGMFSIGGNLVELLGAGTVAAIRVAYGSTVVICENIVEQSSGVKGIDIHVATGSVVNSLTVCGNSVRRTSLGGGLYGIVVEAVSGGSFSAVSIKANSVTGFPIKLFKSGTVTPSATEEI